MTSMLQNVVAQQEANNYGVFKSKYVANTTKVLPTDGKITKIDVLTATVFSELTGNVENIVSATIPAGTTIYGRIDSFTLASGSVICYEGK